ncbi:MAG: type IV pilin protein [Betaproteobacteria bacterium]
MHMQRRGFTLVEMVIVVAIVGILAAIAFPSYQNSVRKTRRTNAEADLVQLSQFMERIYTENGSYSRGGASPALPFTVSPQDGSTSFYSLALTANTGNAFTLTATPIGSQISDGKVEIDSMGAKRWDANHNGSFEGTEQHW